MTDKERLDWLETQNVDVREPARYGSFRLFSANATQHDAEDDYDSDLRAQIDKHMEKR